jgi:hypothetical protein
MVFFPAVALSLWFQYREDSVLCRKNIKYVGSTKPMSTEHILCPWASDEKDIKDFKNGMHYIHIEYMNA